MEFKTLIDKIVEKGKLILAQPTFIFKNKELSFKEYVVRGSDMGRLDLIAEEHYGNSQKIEYLLKFNGISDPFSIKEGDVLKIPIDNAAVVKLKRPKTADNNIVRQSFVDGKRLSKKDQRRIDFLKKKYNINEVLPPNMIKTGYSNSEVDTSGEENITKMGMAVSTPNNTFIGGGGIDEFVDGVLNDGSNDESSTSAGGVNIHYHYHDDSKGFKNGVKAAEDAFKAKKSIDEILSAPADTDPNNLPGNPEDYECKDCE